MNKVILMGRLTRDPEMRQTTGGIQVCSFSIAVNRRFAKDGQQNADFINCTAFGRQGEFAEKYLHKGMKIAVEGRINGNVTCYGKLTVTGTINGNSSSAEFFGSVHGVHGVPKLHKGFRVPPGSASQIKDFFLS